MSMLSDSVYDYMVKVIIIGDSGVGKTNILTRYCENIFKNTHIATIGVDFNVKNIKVDDKIIRLQVWDTAGQERFKTITQTYYKGAAGIILVYSVDSRDSFENIEKWIGHVSDRTSENIHKILVANKIDVKPEYQEVSKLDGEQMAKKFGISFIEVSAKEDLGVDQMFHSLSKDIKDKLEDERKNEFNFLTRTISVSLNKQNKPEVKEGGEKSTCNC